MLITLLNSTIIRGLDMVWVVLKLLYELIGFSFVAVYFLVATRKTRTDLQNLIRFSQDVALLGYEHDNGDSNTSSVRSRRRDQWCKCDSDSDIGAINDRRLGMVAMAFLGAKLQTPRGRGCGAKVNTKKMKCSLRLSFSWDALYSSTLPATSIFISFSLITFFSALKFCSLLLTVEPTTYSQRFYLV
ncbi:hypothetical protein VNO80_20373 [Phaseolus coccineus]|uniref:Uncharacterized protein n=1 Tax=Phaseolus coccineus TaxID=3886 RepID=A0AAN9R0L0_PHACN